VGCKTNINYTVLNVDSTLLDRSLNFLIEDTNIRRFRFAFNCLEKWALKANINNTVLIVHGTLLDRLLNFLIEDTIFEGSDLPLIA
jgi:hypothetical protein